MPSEVTYSKAKALALAKKLRASGNDVKVTKKWEGNYEVYFVTYYPKANPSVKKGKWMKVKAIKINRNGSISLKK